MKWGMLWECRIALSLFLLRGLCMRMVLLTILANAAWKQEIIICFLVYT